MRGFKGYALVPSRVNRKRSTRGGDAAAGFPRSSLGFCTVWVAHLGRRYGILQALSRRRAPAGARTIARACGLHERSVRVWCEAARSLRLIERRGSGYYVPARNRPLLVDEDDPRFLGGQFSYLALRSLDFGAFDALFRKGEVSADGTRHLREASMEATRWDHTSFLRFLLPRVPGLASRLRDGARALDVGCGTGGWVLRMARAFPRSSFTGVDPDRTAIDIARETATAVGAGPRVRFRVGSGGEPTREPGSFDLVYLGEVVYGVKDKLRLLGNCRRALTQDGRLVIAEGLVAPARKSGNPATQLVDAMGLEFALQGARFLERSELEGLLREAGFHRVRFHDAGGGLWFVVARADSRRGGLERVGAARHPRGDR